MKTGKRDGLLRRASLSRGVKWRGRRRNGGLEAAEIEGFGGEGGGGRLL